ncbi:redoxin domain-containing protein [Salisaeta longa]|uniref:redoxin domain-containing protein n=1 Tax=Salisaeta longa TaxID=503170 RepID=UPI0003B3CC6D|nr:peroxiredoxin [Salisaeta longa]
MALSTGTPAPTFTLYSTEMEPVQLSDFEGQPVVLLFFPGAFTSVCTTELNTVNNDLDAFGDAQVLGISTDSPFVLDEFRRVNDLSYPLLSDHDGSVSASYDAKYDNDFTPMQLDRISKRAAYVIDGDGVIRYAEVLDNAGNQPDFDAIKDALRDL